MGATVTTLPEVWHRGWLEFAGSAVLPWWGWHRSLEAGPWRRNPPVQPPPLAAEQTRWPDLASPPVTPQGRQIH